MSGHSKWSTIKRQKGLADVKKGMTFTKLANVITIVARASNSGDIETNHRLRLAVDQARSVNMPKENIQRAIDRGLGKLPGQVLEEVVYEGFGPGKTAFLVEGVTDNKLRTTQLVKNLFDRAGGHLGSPGSTSYMFDKIGLIKIKGQPNASKEDEILEIIDAGAEDVEDFEEEGRLKYLVYTGFHALNEMSNKLTQYGFEVELSEVEYKPNIHVNITDPNTAQKVLLFIDKLEENDDIQNVSANFDIAEDILPQ